MTDPTDREAIRRRARARVISMGLPVRPEYDDQAPAAEPLPTERPAALRALLHRGHLTPGQEVSARRLLADIDRAARQSAAGTDPTDTTPPGDAA